MNKKKKGGTMFTISLMNQKGGAGKTTVTRCLLSAADSLSLKTAFIDTDQTGNLTNWAKTAYGNGLLSNNVSAYQTLDMNDIKDIMHEIEDQGDIDLVLIDTAGDASRGNDIIAIAADLVLCPILLTKTDIETARGTANYIYRMKDRISNSEFLPEFRVVLNRLSTRPSKGDSELLQVIKEQPLVGNDVDAPVEKMKLLPAPILMREAYKIMDNEGLLNKLIEHRNLEGPAFSKNPKHLNDALIECQNLLNQCLKFKEGPAS